MTGKKQPVGDVAEWTGASRDRVYALLAGGMIGDALDEIARYPGLRMNDLAPVDATALTCFEGHLAKDPGIKGVLLAALHHDSQPIRRGARFLAMRVLENPLEDLLEEIARLNASVVEENRKVTERISARVDREIARGETPAGERQWHIRFEEKRSLRRPTPGDEEFAQLVASLAFSTSKTEQLEKVAYATAPPYPGLYHKALLTANSKKLNAEWAKARDARNAKPRKAIPAKGIPSSAVRESDPALQQLVAGGDLSGLLSYAAGVTDPGAALLAVQAEMRGQLADRIMADESLGEVLIEALFSLDARTCRAAAAVMKSLPRFPLMEFLQRLYKEIEGDLMQYSDADRDRLMEIAVAAARVHGTLQAMSFVLEWPFRHDKKWDWSGQILGAIASRYSLGQILEAVRGDALGGKYSYEILAPHVERDPDLSLFSWRRPLRVTSGDFPFDRLLSTCRPTGSEDYIGDHFAGRPDHPLDEHREEMAARLRKDSSLAIRSRDWQFVLDWFWSVYMGDGGFDRLERELWPIFGDEVHAYCLRNKPGPNWYPALSLYMLGAEEPDARLVEKWQTVLSSTGDSNRYGDQCKLLVRFSKAVKLKEWWLPFFRLEWEHLLGDRRPRMESGARELYLHNYEQGIMPFYRHSKQYGSTAYDDALNSILERLEGQTLIEKLTGTRITGDYGLFFRAVVRRETDDEAQALLLHSKVIENGLSCHDLAWRLRETRPEAVRAFLRRWQKPYQNSLPGYFVQRESVETFAAHGLFAEEVTQRIAASLEAKDEEEFNWAFDLAFAYPEMMTAQGVDVLDLVGPRIHRPAKRQIVSDTIRRMMLLGRYGRAPKDRVFAALEEAFQLDDPALWKKAAEGMREFRKEQPQLALSNPDRVKDLIERDPKKYAAIFKGLV